jgi:hypothetical protein
LLVLAFFPLDPLLCARVPRFSFSSFITFRSYIKTPRLARSAWSRAGHGALIKKKMKNNLTRQEQRYNMTTVIKK